MSGESAIAVERGIDGPELPAQWRRVQLGDVSVAISTRDPRRDGSAVFRYIDVASVASEANRIADPRDVVGLDAPSRARQVVHAGDTVFATVRPYLRNIALVPPELHEAICSTGFCVVRPDRRVVDPHFVFFACLTREFVDAVVARQRGSGYPAVSDRDVFSTPIPLPPLPEQRAIAHVLRTVQRAIEATDAVIAATRELKRSMMRHLFTYGPVPVGEVDRVVLKETEIGWVPEGWEVVRIGDIAGEVRSGITPRGGSATYTNHGVPLIRSQNVRMNRLDLTDVAHIDQSVHKMMTRSALRPGDVLLNITGASIGRTAWVPRGLGDANVNQHVCLIRLLDRCSTQYLSFYLASERGQQQVFGNQYGATRQGLNYVQVRAMQVPLPPLREQAGIEAAFRVTMAKESGETARRAALSATFTSLLHHLMTGKLRVADLDLVPQEAQP